MVHVTVPVGDLVDGARRIFEVLSSFDPELERIEVNYASLDARLFYGVTVPNTRFRKTRRTITLDRPLNCTLEAIQNKNLIHTYEIVQNSDTEYQIPVDQLDSSEEYQLIVSGKASREILEKLLGRHHYKGRQTRNVCEHNLVYNPGALTGNDSEVQAVVFEYLDQVEFDDAYIVRRIREAIPESITEWQSNAWTSPDDPDSPISDTATATENLPAEVQELLDVDSKDREWWFSHTVMGDYVTIDDPMNYYNLETSDTDPLIPLSFTVYLRTEFGEGQGQMEGTVTFQKAKFWESVRTELLQRQ